MPSALRSFTFVIGKMPMLRATAMVVTVAVVAASIVAYAVWWLVSDVMPPHVIPISGVIALIVATPIAAYLMWVIRTLAQSHDALASLTNDLKIAHDEAKRANKAKTTFLASTSHELRTPLNAIIGFADIIRNELLGTCGVPRYVEYASDIRRSGLHLLSIINDVLDLSKIELGRGSVNTQERCDLTEIISDCLNVVGVLATAKKIHLEFRRSSGSVTILGNARFLSQLLLNLLSNAIKFTADGGVVRVNSWRNDTGALLIVVSDTGIGMTAEDVANALQPFGQANSRLSREHDGTGLGLPLAKAMVEAHEGSLAIQSVPNKGTTITITVPKHRIIDVTPVRQVGVALSG